MDCVAIFLAAIKFIVGGGILIEEDGISGGKGIWCTVHSCVKYLRSEFSSRMGFDSLRFHFSSSF
jgi:hypothetical protein